MGNSDEDGSDSDYCNSKDDGKGYENGYDNRNGDSDGEEDGSDSGNGKNDGNEYGTSNGHNTDDEDGDYIGNDNGDSIGNETKSKRSKKDLIPLQKMFTRLAPICHLNIEHDHDLYPRSSTWSYWCPKL